MSAAARRLGWVLLFFAVAVLVGFLALWELVRHSRSFGPEAMEQARPHSQSLDPVPVRNPAPEDALPERTYSTGAVYCALSIESLFTGKGDPPAQAEKRMGVTKEAIDQLFGPAFEQLGQGNAFHSQSITLDYEPESKHGTYLLKWKGNSYIRSNPFKPALTVYRYVVLKNSWNRKLASESRGAPMAGMVFLERSNFPRPHFEVDGVEVAVDSTLWPTPPGLISPAGFGEELSGLEAWLKKEWGDARPLLLALAEREPDERLRALIRTKFFSPK